MGAQDIWLHEPIGVAWTDQWLHLKDAPGNGFALVEGGSGLPIPFQILDDGTALCCIDVAAHQAVQLQWHEQPDGAGAAGVVHPAVASVGDNQLRLCNGLLEVCLPATVEGAKHCIIAVVRHSGGSAAGVTLQSRFEGALEGGQAIVRAAGPLSARGELILKLTDGGEYHLDIELRAGEEWIKLHETYSGGRPAHGPVARTVWSYHGFEARDLVCDGWPGTVATMRDARVWEQPFGIERGVLAALGAQTVFGQVGAPWAILSDGATAIGAIVVSGGEWQYPGAATLRLRRTGRGPELSAECECGGRQWVLLLGRHETWFPRAGEAALAVAALKARAGDLPLDAVRHWQLSASARPEPRLFVDATGLAAARLELQTVPWQGLQASLSPKGGDELAAQPLSTCFALCGTTPSFDDGVRWLQGGDEAAGLALAKQICEFATAAARHLGGCGLLAGGLDVVALRPLKLCLYWHDALRGSGLAGADEAAATERALLFCAYCLYQRSYFDWKGATAAAESPHSLRRFLLEEAYSDTLGCQNFHSDIYSYLGAVGLVFDDHPMAPIWVEHAENMGRQELEMYVAPDGTYVESDNYYQHFLGLIYYLAWALVRAGRAKLSQHPRLKAGLGYWVRAQTSPLFKTGSEPTAWYGSYCAAPQARPVVQMLPLGDCGLNWGGQALPSFLHHAANHYAQSDALLAGWLEWTWRRAGRPLAQYAFMVPELLTQQAAAGPPPLAYPLASCELNGHGVLLRAEVGTATESCALISCGRATSHMHWDAGSLQLWHAGVPLVVDAGYIHDEFTPKRAYGGASYKHSTVTFCVGDDELSNGYGGMELRPSPRAVVLGEHFDYGECDLSQNNLRGESWRDMRGIVAIEHYRQVLFVKNRYLVINDRIQRSIYPAVWHLWTLSESEEVAGNFALIRGSFGIDLALTLLQPENGVISAESYSTARHLSVRQAAERDFSAVLQPLRRGAKLLTATALAGGVQVAGVDFCDRVYFDPVPGWDNDGNWHRLQRAAMPPETMPPGARCCVWRNGQLSFSAS